MSDDRDPLDVLSGEPMLGPRQAKVVDALVHRLHHGPRLSDADLAVSCWLQRTVGLEAAVISAAPPPATTEGEHR